MCIYMHVCNNYIDYSFAYLKLLSNTLKSLSLNFSLFIFPFSSLKIYDYNHEPDNDI